MKKSGKYKEANIRNKHLIQVLLAVLVAILQSCSGNQNHMINDDVFVASGSNKSEIIKALNHYPKNSLKSKAMIFLLNNMVGKKSYGSEISEYVIKRLQENENEDDISQVWRETVSLFPTPEKSVDLEKLKATYLIRNIDVAFDSWKHSKWHNEIDFEHFCDYILPYSIMGEPVVDWRKFLHDKYSFLIKDCNTQKQAFSIVFEYITKHFPVRTDVAPYEKDALLLDKLGSGDCKARTMYMTYVMRALGIAASFDYTPVWVNCSGNSHSWVSLVPNDNKAFCGLNDTAHYIDGTFEKTKHIIPQDYRYSVDTLKRIAKIYRKTFRNTPSCADKYAPGFLQSSNDMDVTAFYPNITHSNSVRVKCFQFKQLYTCIYRQQEGWFPIGIAARKGLNTVDVGDLLDDCIVIIAKYDDDKLTPVSSPYKIGHHTKPIEIVPEKKQRQLVKLFRKYMVSNRWTNRWGTLIGTTIETSDDRMFENIIDTIYIWEKMPIETSVISTSYINGNYIRIKPSDARYPVFAEIHLFDKNNQIITQKEYDIYSVGEGLTGDSIVVKSLVDNDERTTFYKQFPFWIGMDVSKCKDKILKIEFIMWNDYNRVTSGHNYELFYWDGDWVSLGKQRAHDNYLIYKDVPVGCLFLLKDYTKGKEERIFEYVNGKQVWW